jgi:hypothetical protein
VPSEPLTVSLKEVNAKVFATPPDEEPEPSAKSVPAVNVNVPPVVAVVPAVAKEPPALPVVCDLTSDAATFVLNEVAEVPYVVSAVIPAKSFNMETSFAPLAADEEPEAVN